jgi:hypothetical protein
MSPLALILLIGGSTVIGLGILDKLKRSSSEKKVFVAYQLVPGSQAQIDVFRKAARAAGLPESWASAPGLISILSRESGGWVGIPNYTYGARASDQSQWAEIHDELRRGIVSARSSATGLGQLLLGNVDSYYPSGRAGIGVAHDEAVGMLRYIKKRYGTPAEAWRCYGKICPEYGKTFQEGY